MFDPLTNFSTIEIVQITTTSAASRVHCFNGAQYAFHVLLAEKLTECINNDTVADAEKQVEWGGHDSFRQDSEYSHGQK